MLRFDITLGNAADIMGSSIQGAIANMKTRVLSFGRNDLGPLFTGGQDQASPIVNMVKKIQDSVDGLNKMV